MGRLVVAAIDRVFRVGLTNMKNMSKDLKERVIHAGIWGEVLQAKRPYRPKH